MVSTGPSSELIAESNKLGVDIFDPVVGDVSSGNVIGLRQGKRYGRRSSTMSPQEREDIINTGQFDMIRDPADPQELLLQITDTPMPGRENEIEIDVSVAVTGKDAFEEMMNAFKNDDGTWEQIAEGLFFNDFIVPEGDFSEIYEYENVANGMLAAVSEANAFAQAGGAGLGRAPTIDALLKATDPEALQKKFNEITKSRKAPQYSRNTIIAMAEQAASTHLQRGLSNEQMQAVVAAVHALPTDQKMNIGSEVGAIVSGLDPERAAGVKAYNSAQNVKNALGLK